jgi:hypothetical protein
MTGLHSFRKKIIYGILIAILLVPISFISRPASRQKDGTISGGGQLARMRSEYGLSLAELGDIDPASESMKLATLGMRGVATTFLWERSNRFKRQQDWDSLSATLNQISKLQPNFLSVWQFQGWNLAYNVSVEFDDYRSRYHWVKKGIDFLARGIQYNHEEPVLFGELGWTFGHKLGKADEYVQYRRLFRADDDFHRELSAHINMDNTRGVDDRPDNWLVGRQWFLRGEDLLDAGVPMGGRLITDMDQVKRGKSPLIYHSHAPKWIMNYASAIEQEGNLGEKAQIAWRDAGVSWNEFGNRDIATSYGFTIRLNDTERLRQEQARLLAELDSTVVGVRDKLLEEKHAALTPLEREVLDTPPELRTPEQVEKVAELQRQTAVSHEEVADRAPPNVSRTAKRLARKLLDLESRIRATNSYRDQVAYGYWKTRCEIEQTDAAIEARRLIYEADEAYEQADLEGMKEKYEAAWDRWAQIYEKHPEMVETPDAEDIYEAVMRYREVLEQLDLPWPPKGFKLNRLVKYYDETFRPADADESPEKPAEANDVKEPAPAKSDADPDEAKPVNEVGSEAAAQPEAAEAPNRNQTADEPIGQHEETKSDGAADFQIPD